MSQDDFIGACDRGDLTRARTELAKVGVCVDREYRWEKYTALGRACAGGHLNVVRWLIEDAGACINITERDGNTPFWFACWYGQLNVAKYLTTRGIDPRAPNDCGQTPFWAACYCGHLKVAQWLAITVRVKDDVTRAPTTGWARGITPSAITGMCGRTIATWLALFLQRRVLIAYWGAGRDRCRAGLPCLGYTSEATVWHRLPREALADVLLLLGS